jgi:hypothetical protein
MDPKRTGTRFARQLTVDEGAFAMQDYVTFGGALAFLLGILAVGMSGNRGMRFRSLIFLFGVAFILAGTGAEVSALLASHGSSAATAQSSDSPVQG